MTTTETNSTVVSKPKHGPRGTLFTILTYKGRAFQASGELGFLESGRYRVAYIADSRGTTMVLDQRTKILVGEDIVFDPEINRAWLFPDVERWIEANSSWKSVVDRASLKCFSKHWRFNP